MHEKDVQVVQKRLNFLSELHENLRLLGWKKQTYWQHFYNVEGEIGSQSKFAHSVEQIDDFSAEIGRIILISYRND